MEASWEHLDRQDWHLWILAVLLIVVLGGSLLSFMFPSAFWFAEELPLRAPNRAFIGFCVLLALVLIYMLQRQAGVRALRRRLYQALTEAKETERRSLLAVLETLPGLNQFCDSLAMEYRRAFSAGHPLSVVLFEAPNCTQEERGQVAMALRHMLRRGESLFRLPGHVLGFILPGMELNAANSFAVQAEENLRVEMPDVRISSTVNSYPDEASSYSELEASLRSRIA